MYRNKNSARKARAAAAVTVLLFSAFLGATASLSAAAPTPLALEPQTVQGSTDASSATPILFNTSGAGFYGALNTTTGGIEPIRGGLQASLALHNHYYKIDLPRGKVLDVRLFTIAGGYVSCGPGCSRVSPDFELFTYAGVPGPSTMLDWNIQPFSNRLWQENNILTPIAPSATYYINVSNWFGQGYYDLTITVSDPPQITGGDYSGGLDAESQNPGNPAATRDADTAWYRFSATHDTAAQIFHEASGWLDITNWQAAPNDQAVDAIIRVFAEDTGYSPTNPIGKPIEKSEAPNRKIEPFNVLAPYTGTYYIMLRISNTTSVSYNLHFNLTPIPRMPAGGLFGVHKERVYDDTDWFWFNMSKGGGSTPADRVVFNLSEQSDDPLKPVNLNLWLFGYRDYFTPAGATADFDILNSSFEGDAPYNLTQNPEPRYEEVAAQAAYTGIYFLEVEAYNNTGNYTLTQSFDTSANRQPSDLNNEPSQAPLTEWGQYTNLNISQSEDHSDFYKVSARAGETIEVTFEMPRRTSPDFPPSVTNSTIGLIWIGIYQPGMELLSWAWNYHFDYANNQPTDYLDSFATARATVAADAEYIVEITAMQDGYIAPFTLPTTPPRTLQVFWHMDWNFATTYTMWISRLPSYNAQFETPIITGSLPDVVLPEGGASVGLYNLSNFFSDPDILQGDSLNYSFTFSGLQNVSISESNGLVTIRPLINPGAQPPVNNTDWYGTNTIQVRATDEQKNYIAQYWNITYLPVNDLPYVVSSTPITFIELASDTSVKDISLFSTIRDVDGDTLQFQQVTDSNITLAFTDTLMRVSTAPDFQTTSLGAPYPVFVDVFDGTTTTRLQLLFVITNDLDAPRILAGNRVFTCDEDVDCPVIDLNSIFYDPDDPLRLQPLTFTVSGNEQIAYTKFNGSLLLDPPADWSGAKTIQVQAIKYSGSPPNQQAYASDVVELSLVVTEVNDPPVLQEWSPPPHDVTVTEGGARSFAVTAVDPEFLQPTFKWYLDEVSVDNTLPSYQFLALYTYSRPGNNAVMTLKVVIADGTGGETVHEWAITVLDQPRSPQVTVAAPLEGNRGYTVGQPVQFLASAFDPDNDVLEFYWTRTDTGGQILDAGEGEYTFTDTGTFRIQLEVFDGPGKTGNKVTSTVNVTIQPAPNPPGFLPGFDAPLTLGALVAVVAVAAVVARRRRVA